MTPPRLATVEEVAEYLQVPTRTLYHWRSQGTGPAATLVGRRLRFRWSDVEVWLAKTNPDRDHRQPRSRSRR